MVTREKVADYLLNRAHPDNGGKAAFFEGLGFRRREWKMLAKALMALAAGTDVTTSTESPHGRKYVIVGHVKSSSGNTAAVQTTWIVDKGREAARLVTAYPHKT